jgi:transcriptional regulator with XRE-family HTH domain
MSVLSVSTEQVKAGRALLRWSQQDLASASGVSLPTIKRLEAEIGDLGGRASTGEAIKRAFEEAGVTFIAENGGGAGVRLRHRRDGGREFPRTIAFSDEARTLLRRAAEGDGLVAFHDFIIGSQVTAGGFAAQTPGTGREDARWRAAISSLANQGLIEERSPGSGLYVVTREGRKAAERNAQQIQDADNGGTSR